ncbi:MAG TPA: hypothetical protein VNB49_09865 [Candidatus Dormibacteraeota bacterium]|nr:hypothetical protein [Candidatus Dormibacteraeota bacterium]
MFKKIQLQSGSVESKEKARKRVERGGFPALRRLLSVALAPSSSLPVSAGTARRKKTKQVWLLVNAALNSSGVLINPTGFGTVNGSRGPRIVQTMVKLEF